VSAYHLAQVNVGRLLAPVDDPRIDDFRNALDQINALADSQPGFVWRLKGEGDNATDLRPDASDDLQAVNASVWESPDHLAAFAYRSEHRNFVRRRLEWFEPATQPILALWWVPAGHPPSLTDCLERLAHLRAHGPTPHAFTFRQRFEAPTAEEAAA
jgi:heme-degrading monooxygenase HmoA